MTCCGSVKVVGVRTINLEVSGSGESSTIDDAECPEVIFSELEPGGPIVAN